MPSKQSVCRTLFRHSFGVPSACRQPRIGQTRNQLQLMNCHFKFTIFFIDWLISGKPLARTNSSLEKNEKGNCCSLFYSGKYSELKIWRGWIFPLIVIRTNLYFPPLIFIGIFLAAKFSILLLNLNHKFVRLVNIFLCCEDFNAVRQPVKWQRWLRHFHTIHKYYRPFLELLHHSSTSKPLPEAVRLSIVYRGQQDCACHKYLVGEQTLVEIQDTASNSLYSGVSSIIGQSVVASKPPSMGSCLGHFSYNL